MIILTEVKTLGRSSLSGTPWHYEGPYRGGRSKCAHWVNKNGKGFCKINEKRCSRKYCSDYTVEGYNIEPDKHRYDDPAYASPETKKEIQKQYFQRKYEKWLGSLVESKLYGIGTVIEIDDKYMKVKFESHGIKSFVIPKAIETGSIVLF